MNTTALKAALVAGLIHGNAMAQPEKPGWRPIPPLPDAFGFASPFAGISGGALLVAGGANFCDKPLWEGGSKVWHEKVFALLPGASEWKVVGQLPGRRAYGISASIAEGVICAGGSDAEGHSAEVFLLQWKEGSLLRRDLPPLPKPVAMGTGARLGDLLYLSGGLDSPTSQTPLSTFLALDLRHPESGWKELPPCPGPGRFQAVAAVADGWFYLFSGLRYEDQADGKKALVYLKDAYRYSPASGWERLPDLPHAAAAAASPAPSGNTGIYLIGGVDGSGAGKAATDFFHVPQRIQRYSPVDRTWQEAGNAPMARVCVSTIEYDGVWVLASGERSAGVRSPEVWSLSLPK